MKKLKMKRPKGPELKMPELKAPAFLSDLYYDLRDRRLLPLVALVLVAIAAVPFLLGGDGEEPYVPAPGAGLSALGSTGPGSKLTVVEATPGLREYRKRLADRSPTDPFKQRYTGLPESAQLESGSSGSEGGEGGGSLTVTESTTETAETGESTESGSSGGPPTGGTGGGGGQGRPPRLIQFVVDVQISHMETAADGQQQMSEPEVRNGIRPFHQLPGTKAPVVTPMGINLHNGKVFFLVSDEVTSLGGEFNCVTRTPKGVCELLEIERGMQLEATYGPGRVLYLLKVIKIDVALDGRAGDNRSSRAAFLAPLANALPTP
jgi:hypothetical protein